jgi:hypothetical protein
LEQLLAQLEQRLWQKDGATVGAPRVEQLPETPEPKSPGASRAAI